MFHWIVSLFFYGCLISLLMGCREAAASEDEPSQILVVLGIAQDAGFPQAQCQKSCCLAVWDHPEKHRKAACMAVVDLDENVYWLIDATPDFKLQTHWIESKWGVALAGIFLTHAHVGHYTGLIHLGREITGASEMPIYAMPRMMQFLQENAPWDQLIGLNNISLQPLRADSSILIAPKITITPFLVPHRDEYTETAGFKVRGEHQQAIFIPDIDKWQKWDRNLETEVASVDLAFIDGSFFKQGELPGRDMSTIPHPFVVESMEILKNLAPADRNKVHFIHMNHTNPLLLEQSEAQKVVKAQGFQVAKEGTMFPI